MRLALVASLALTDVIRGLLVNEDGEEVIDDETDELLNGSREQS
jgi:hypothetical protein